MDSDVIVVGAGVAGLACAAHLAWAGLRVTVLEQGDAAGGRACSWHDDGLGIEVDIGPHVVSTEHRNFMSLLERLGTAGQIAWQPDPLITLVDSRGVLRMPNRQWTPPFHGLPLVPQALRRLSIGDLMSHWRVAWAGARADEQSLRGVDGEDACGWLRRHGVSERSIDCFWRSAMLALLNVRLEDCSAAAVLRIFRLMLGRSGYHFGFPTTGLSQLYVPGCTRVVEAAGGSMRLGLRAMALQLHERGQRGVALVDGSLLEAEHVVLAVPPEQAAELLHGSDTESLAPLAAAAAQFQPSPYVSTWLAFDRPLTQERFWGKVWSEDGLNTDFYDLSNIRPELQGGPALIACNAIGPQARPEWPDERIVQATLAELSLFVPQVRADRLQRARVHRIPMAIPQPRPGTEGLRPPNATALGRLWLAGDWTDTAVPCSMESAARSGALAAEGVLQQLGRSAAIAIAAPETHGLVGLLRRR